PASRLVRSPWAMLIMGCLLRVFGFLLHLVDGLPCRGGSKRRFEYILHMRGLAERRQGVGMRRRLLAQQRQKIAEMTARRVAAQFLHGGERLVIADCAHRR